MTMVDDIRILLGLGAADLIRRVGEDAAPSGDAALGWAQQERSIDDLAAQALASLGLLDVDVQGLARCKRLDFDPRLVVVEITAGVDVLGVTRTIGDDLVLLDTRVEAGFVHWFADDGEWIARFLRGDCEEFLIEREVPASLRAFQHGAVPDLPALDVPSSAHFFADQGAAEWLAAAVEARRTSPSLLDRVAAAGMIRRLWSLRPHEASATVQHLLAGGEVPPTRVDAWAKTLSADVLDEVEAIAIRAAGGLEDEIAELPEIHAGAPASVALAVLAIAHRRDDLGSILAVLRTADGGALLAAALVKLDRVADFHATALAAASSPGDDEHLTAVSWSEPEAWWGEHAGD